LSAYAGVVIIADRDNTTQPSAFHLPPSALFYVHRRHNEDLFESTKMTFGEHLEELRRSLFKAVLALMIGFGIALVFADRVVDYIQTPLRAALKEHYGRTAALDYRRILDERRAEGLPVPADTDQAVRFLAEEGLVAEERYLDRRQWEALRTPSNNPEASPTAEQSESPDLPRRSDLVPVILYHDLDRDSRLQLIGLGAQEPFVVYMKAAFVVGAILASPFVFYFIWQFVAAGLYPHERRYVHIFLPFSVGFFVVFRYVLRFLLWFYELTSIDPDLRISDWLSFVLVLPLGFGVSFQLPLVMLFLERIGIFTVESYVSFWKVSVLVICFLSMVLTPSGDPQSMILMAVPLLFLYVGGVLLCKMMPRRTTPFGEVIT
jgi:sec-independent protein translocase protein TatC